MSTQLVIYVDSATEERLRAASAQHGRSPEDLAASAVENYMADVARRTPVLRVGAYRCPVCAVADPNAYLRCNRPDCTDGRDPR